MKMSNTHHDFVDKIYRGEYLDIVRNTIKFVARNIDTNDLKDCVSEVYMIAMQKQNIDKHPNIKGWLTETARNIAKDYKKRQGIQMIRRAPSFEESVDPVSPEELIEKQESDEEFLDFLEEKLKPQEFALYKLKYKQHRTNEEIAKKIGIKKHSVDVKLTRLNKKLRNILEKP
jgi:RNA polymerase sigma factor (sigma-70 family)